MLEVEAKEERRESRRGTKRKQQRTEEKAADDRGRIRRRRGDAEESQIVLECVEMDPPEEKDFTLLGKQERRSGRGQVRDQLQRKGGLRKLSMSPEIPFDFSYVYPYARMPIRKKHVSVLHHPFSLFITNLNRPIFFYIIRARVIEISQIISYFSRLENKWQLSPTFRPSQSLLLRRR